MRRILIGWLLVLHGLAHAALGVWLAGDNVPTFVIILWMIALVGFMGAGFGVLRLPLVRDRWKTLVVTGAVASSLLCVGVGGGYGLVGFLLNLVFVIATTDVQQRRIDASVAVVDAIGAEASAHPRWLRFGWTLGLATLAYVAIVVAIRPVYVRYGTTAEERFAPLPGDDVLSTDARYRVDHAITIHAPARAVWPWIAQLGQDRGGFYSYDWLERAVGADIRNADRIHPEWQQRAVGDTVYATQASYAGGRLGKVGWRISAIEPERVLVLEKWGAFVLRPIDSNTTRLIIRTREPGTKSALAFVLSPFNVFVFEPAHFIMQRAMLRGIRDRAERAARESAPAV
jgi:hypothetical protein